jgi:hypothetical protein
MSEINKDQNIDMNDIATNIAGSNWLNELQKQATEIVDSPAEDTTNNTQPAVYDGPGLVINKEELKEQEDAPKFNGGVTPAINSDIKKYMEEMDEIANDPEKKKEHLKQIDDIMVNINGGMSAVIDTSNDTDADEVEDSEAPVNRDEYLSTYAESVVLIDKTGMSQIIDFTAEEREKLEHSKVIKLKEIEELPLKTIKSKRKEKKGDLKTIINRVISAASTQIVLPASGYTAIVNGCSAHEVMQLINIIESESNGVKLAKIESKWSFIYSKIKSTSLGNMTFEEFLSATSVNEIDTLIYGIIVATYPDETDKYPIKCPKCKKTIQIPYTNKSLIRAEKISPKLNTQIEKIIIASSSLEHAKEIHLNSPINEVKRIVLPTSGIICDFKMQSAYDFIYKSVGQLLDNLEAKYEAAAIQTMCVDRMFVPDPEDPSCPYEIEDQQDIMDIIFSLSSNDAVIVAKYANDMYEDCTFQYGIMDITCPNKSCNNYIPSIPLRIENILFLKWQREMNTIVE